MYPMQPVFPSVAMWQRVLRIRTCMYQDEQQKKLLAETQEDTDEQDIYEQRASWKQWMERIYNAQTLFLESSQQELNFAETIDHVLETLLDSEEWENFDKFKDNDNGFKDIR